LNGGRIRSLDQGYFIYYPTRSRRPVKPEERSNTAVLGACMEKAGHTSNSKAAGSPARWTCPNPKARRNGEKRREEEGTQ
jgi:hypothetical protein